MNRFVNYHPDPEIDAELTRQAIENEEYDLSVGYPPRWWTCPVCKKSHNRGHFQAIGTHRCLNCGYVGSDGRMHTNLPGTRG